MAEVVSRWTELASATQPRSIVSFSCVCCVLYVALAMVS